jgi:hypothetical protein
LKRKARRTRPCHIAEHCWATLLPPDQFSFPSGHTITAFSFAVAFSLFYPSLMPGLLFCAFSVALSRMILGMHFLSDVFVGAGLGAVLAWSSAMLVTRILMSRSEERRERNAPRVAAAALGPLPLPLRGERSACTPPDPLDCRVPASSDASAGTRDCLPFPTARLRSKASGIGLAAVPNSVESLKYWSTNPCRRNASDREAALPHAVERGGEGLHVRDLARHQKLERVDRTLIVREVDQSRSYTIFARASAAMLLRKSTSSSPVTFK